MFVKFFILKRREKKKTLVLTGGMQGTNAAFFLPEITKAKEARNRIASCIHSYSDEIKS